MRNLPSSNSYISVKLFLIASFQRNVSKVRVGGKVNTSSNLSLKYALKILISWKRYWNTKAGFRLDLVQAMKNRLPWRVWRKVQFSINWIGAVDAASLEAMNLVRNWSSADLLTSSLWTYRVKGTVEVYKSPTGSSDWWRFHPFGWSKRLRLSSVPFFFFSLDLDLEVSLFF